MSNKEPTSSPLISVIICTYNGQEMFERAFRSVAGQHLTDFEVIVVDDGSEPPIVVPGICTKPIRLIQRSHRGVGASRAKGLSVAQGKFIAYCDDDDEWTPNHLGALLGYLLEHPDVDLAYADSAWVQAGGPEEIPYSRDYDGWHLSGSNYIFATDVMHRATAAREAGGFDPTLRAHEDWDLWLRMSGRHRLRHLPIVLSYHYWHDGCVSAGDHWKEHNRVFASHQTRLAQGGLAARHDVIPSPKRVPFDRRTWQDDRKELIWQALMDSTGFGFVARHLLLALERRGVNITMASTENQPPFGLERFYKPVDNWGRIAFYYDVRRRPSVLECCERLVMYSTWEDTVVPQEQIEEINRAATLLYVPCKQNLESFRDCGVLIPIKVLHHGVDPEQFPYLPRERSRETFTFGSFGAFSVRKGIDVLARAFLDEFSPQEPARLLLRSTGAWSEPPASDPRVTVLSGFVGHAGLLNFLQELDAFVLPSRGEGFGLCGLEAMSTGLPLIATNWSGPADYLDPRDSFPLSYDLVPAGGVEAHNTRFVGSWAEPNREHLRSLMRALYEHRENAFEKGRLAAERIHREWGWDRAARQICRDLEEIASQ